jgi:hypothetical protein
MEETVMKPISAMFAAVAISIMALSTAMADCPEAGSAQNDTQKGISKDGTHAPLDDSANAKTQSGAASTGTTTSHYAILEVHNRNKSS